MPGVWSELCCRENPYQKDLKAQDGIKYRGNNVDEAA